MAITWDKTLLPFQSIMFARRNLSRTGGLTVSGIEQVVQSSSDFWEATVTLKIRKREQVLAYRALQAQNWGRAGQWLIPACGGYLDLGVDVSFGDDFGDDFSTIPPPATALTNSAAIRGARSLTIHMGDTSWTPLPGHYFSIGDRLYLIGTVATLTPTGTFIVTFSPGLRAGILPGTILDFANAHCLMRLAQDNIGQMDLESLRFSNITLNFVEIPV